MKKKFFSIIGKPLSHSLSPILHNYWFKKYKINAEYSLLEIEENQISSVIKKIKERELSGINVTLPYKKKIIPYISNIVNDAKESNSVNTVYLDSSDNLIGENTDVFGLQAGYLRTIIGEINKKDIKVLILGAGGVAPSIIIALKKSNINDISITNRTHDKALSFKKVFPNIKIIEWENYINKTQLFDIIINATSLGLKGGQQFESLFKNVKPGLIYLDTIYNPLNTKMTTHLKSKGIKVFNGLDMFMYQGQKSFYIWNKINPEIDEDLINLLESKI